MKTKALEEEYKKLSEEQGKLQSQSDKLVSVVEGLKKVRKTLLVSMGMMVLAFALFQRYKNSSRQQVIEDSSIKIEHWIKYENGTALDMKTGLLWMTKDFRNIEKTTPKNWDEAMAWADKINEEYFARFSNWRLPSIDEYQATLNPDRTKPAFDQKKIIRWVT